MSEYGALTGFYFPVFQLKTDIRSKYEKVPARIISRSVTGKFWQILRLFFLSFYRVHFARKTYVFMMVFVSQTMLMTHIPVCVWEDLMACTVKKTKVSVCYSFLI